MNGGKGIAAAAFIQCLGVLWVKGSSPGDLSTLLPSKVKDNSCIFIQAGGTETVLEHLTPERL